MAQCQLLARVLHAETTRRAGCPLAPEHGENKNSCANRARIKACPAHKVAAGLSPYRKLAPQLACPSIRGPPETTNCGDAFFHDCILRSLKTPPITPQQRDFTISRHGSARGGFLFYM